MKKMMIMGGFLGFLIGTATGVAQHSSWNSILWRASVAALVAGFLLRWWGQVWMNGLAEAYQEKLAAAEAQEQKRAEKPSR
jgi:hypothetical protein